MNQAVARPEEAIRTLNNLIETCRDGQNGYAEAAENLKSPDIREFFLEQSRARAQFVGELQQEVSRLGQAPETSGSAAAALHRAWINVKAALGGGDHAILAAAETGEDSAVKEYRKALDQRLPRDLEAMLQKQYQSIQQAHDRVKKLRDGLQ